LGSQHPPSKVVFDSGLLDLDDPRLIALTGGFEAVVKGFEKPRGSS
jgi:hypothetical protein